MGTFGYGIQELRIDVNIKMNLTVQGFRGSGFWVNETAKRRILKDGFILLSLFYKLHQPEVSFPGGLVVSAASDWSEL